MVAIIQGPMLVDARGMSERVCRSDQRRRDKRPESINDAVALSCVSIMKQREPTDTG